MPDHIAAAETSPMMSSLIVTGSGHTIHISASNQPLFAEKAT
jgi:hypothetical protein